MNEDLLKAILSMDSYNRGYGFGLDLGGGISSETINNQVGGYKIVANSTVAFGVGSDSAQSKGFYAIAYENLSTNKVTISYRGTDQFLTDKSTGGDILTGYSTGGGDADNDQTRLAIEFYKTVNDSVNGVDADNYDVTNISVTGHSMGAGFAGLVGAI